MIGLLDNLNIEASNGTVPINYSDALVTKISITDIQIMEAKLTFPTNYYIKRLLNSHLILVVQD